MRPDMAAYVKILESQRDATENQIAQLEGGRMRLFRVTKGGEDAEITQEQIKVLRNQVNELNRAIEYAKTT